MKRLKVLVACEESQVVCKAFRELGHEAYSNDLIECSGGHPEWHIVGDAVEVANKPGWDLMIAHPPCTRLANSGVRWLHEPPKGRSLYDVWKEFFDGVAFYKALRCAPIRMKCIENPVFHKYARKEINPGFRHIVQPWWFGDEMFKATGFELIGLPELTATNKLTPPEKGTEEHKKWSWVHRCSPGPYRAKIRSKTPKGIGRAMAEQWSEYALRNN